MPLNEVESFQLKAGSHSLLLVVSTNFTYFISSIDAMRNLRATSWDPTSPVSGTRGLAPNAGPGHAVNSEQCAKAGRLSPGEHCHFYTRRTLKAIIWHDTHANTNLD